MCSALVHYHPDRYWYTHYIMVVNSVDQSEPVAEPYVSGTQHSLRVAEDGPGGGGGTLRLTSTRCNDGEKVAVEL